MRITHYGNKKINKLLKELEMYHLILRWHRGQGKPNRIYVNNVLVEDLNWSPVKAKTGSLNVNDRRVHMATTNGRFCGAKRPECEADRPQAVAFIE